jgi:hypothetical protein
MAGFDYNAERNGRSAVDGDPVTPSDTADLTTPSRGLYIGSVSGGTTLRITTVMGKQLDFTGLVVGTVYPYAARRVHSTGTTVSSIVALY